MDRIEETIKEIAAKHGIAVGRNDPILILETINKRLLMESSAAQQANLDAFKSNLEEISSRWGEDAKNKAERTLSASLAASKEVMASCIEKNSKATADAAKREIEKVVSQELEPSILEAKRIAIMNLIAAGMTVFAAALALWATW